MKILVVETQHTVPIGTFGPPLIEAGAELVYWRTQEEAPPASLDGFVGVVALGGAANPDQDAEYAWLNEERRLLEAAVERRLPTIGLCLGAELLAQVLGGETGLLAPPRIGWFEIAGAEATRDDPLAAHLPARFVAFEWHGHQMTLPPGATLLAGDERAPQTFVWEDFAWGFQFHLEANEHTIGTWIAHYRDELRERALEPTTLMRETRQRAASYEAVARTVAHAFAQLVWNTAPAVLGTRP